jgi:T-complex protein 1 subunit theta
MMPVPRRKKIVLTISIFRMGLKPTEVAEGYERALEKALEVLETLSCFQVADTKDTTSVEKAIR